MTRMLHKTEGNRRLNEIFISEVVAQKQSLIFARQSDSVETVLGVLNMARVLSVPVVEDGVKAWGGNRLPLGDGTTVIGIVSVIDLVAYVLRQGTLSVYDLETTESTIVDEQSLKDALAAPVSNALGATSESMSLWVAPTDTDLLSVMEHFARGNIHRAVVPAPAPEAITKLLTQTDVVAYAWAHRRESATLAALFEKAPRDLFSIGVQDVVSVVESAELGKVLTKMVEKNVVAVPVIHETSGVVVDTLSLSNLRSITASNLRGLYGTSVADFLAKQRTVNDQLAKPQVAFELDQKLGDVIDGMLRWRVHRAWLIDAAGKPVGVISLTDIISAIYAAECGATVHNVD